MNFFEHQDEARTKSGRLLALFCAAILAISLAIYVAFVLIEPFATPTSSVYSSSGTFDFRQPALFVACVLGTLGIVGLGVFLKIKSLGRGGAAIAESLGGKRVHAATTDPHERRLVNVVEEMAIASGVPVPAVFVLDDERGINAFAAGYELGDAAVAVTRGALHVLTRDELQGVVAHEFSHILNGDMRLNIRLIGVLYGIMMIGSTGAWILEKGIFVGSGRGRRDSRGVPIMIAGGLLLWLVGSVGLFCGKMIQRAVSRQREYLADASAVQFTRNPDGLAGALKKIGGYDEGARVHARDVAEMSHMFFGDAISKGGSLFSTHPPLTDRIRRIDPAFGGAFSTVPAPASLLETAAPIDQRHVAATMPFAGGVSTAVAPHLARSATITASSVVDQIGTVTPEHLHFSRALLDSIPDELREASRSTLGAVALVYALMMEDDSTTEQELSELKALTHPRIYAETARLVPITRALDPMARLPLIELSIGSLRDLSPDQYSTFRRELGAIAAADRRLSVFEFAVQKSVIHWLDSAFGLRPAVPVQYYAARALKEEISLVLSALAYAAAVARRDAFAAFQTGAGRLRLLNPGEIALMEPEACGLHRLDAVLDRLKMASAAVKQQVVDACAHVVLADGEIDPAEGELLRVVADAIGCPTPPIIPTSDSLALPPSPASADQRSDE